VRVVWRYETKKFNSTTKFTEIATRPPVLTLRLQLYKHCSSHSSTQTVG